MRLLLILVPLLAAVTAIPFNQRIVGGTVTDIGQYPFATALLNSWSGSAFSQSCGGTILNFRSVLTAAHCFDTTTIENWRIRVGSTYGNSGGIVHNIQSVLNNPLYREGGVANNNDVAILRSATIFVFNDNVRSARFAGTNYNLPDNASVWAIGWGRTAASYIEPGGTSSEELRQVEVWVVNQVVCRTRYAEIGHTVTDSMLCAGWLDVGGRDQCQGDSGGPLIHNNVIVGVCSWGESCALARYPGVNARVSRFMTWIQNNA